MGGAFETAQASATVQADGAVLMTDCECMTITVHYSAVDAMVAEYMAAGWTLIKKSPWQFTVCKPKAP